MNTLKSGDVLESIHIEEAMSDGKSLARHEGFVLFVSGGVPGDVADIEVTYKKKKYADSKIKNLISPSKDRVTAFCSHFGVCGGCKWQHFSYTGQLQFKQKQVTDALTRIGKIEIGETLPIIPSASTQYYRNRLDFTFSNKRWLTTEEIKNEDAQNTNALGFHIPQRFDKILDIQTCYLQSELSDQIRNSIKEFAILNRFTFFDLREQVGFLRNLIIRSTSTGEWMVILVFRENNKDAIEKIMNHVQISFPQITSLLYIINEKRNDTIFDQKIETWNGRDHIFEEMEGLKFKISAKSFYQTNSLQAYELYKVARDFAQFKGNELVYDLYTGTGTIANFIAGRVKKVIGFEYIEDATKDAEENSRINGITNTAFVAGDLKDILTNEIISHYGKPDVIITDPPRAGMHEEVVKRIIDLSPEKIVYVSCNPSTQARDLNLLTEKYAVEKIQAVDMFPQTSHIENVALLKRRI